MRTYWFPICMGGFFSGIFVRSFFDFGPAFPIFLLLLSAVCAGYAGFERLFTTIPALGEKIKTPIIFLFAIFFCVLALGILRFDITDIRRSPIFEGLIGERIVFEGLIIDEPEERERNTQLIVHIDRLTEPNDTGARHGGNHWPDKLLVITEWYPEYNYGDAVRVSGTLKEIANFEVENGRVFDYAAYLAKDGIHYRMFYPEIAVLSHGHGSAVKSFLFELKNRYLASLKRVLPSPHVSLLGGLLLGVKQSLGARLLDELRTVGLIHIVVLSGYNITIISDAAQRLFRMFLPRGASMVFGALGILLFSMMVGGGATVARAAIMAMLIMLARATGRTYDITRALILAAFFMVLQNPRILVYDPSFQLSFMATIALIAVAPVLEKRLTWIPSRWHLREVAATTIGTQLFVLPLILYMTGIVSVVAFPVNLLVLVVLPATMLMGFIAGALGMIATPAALPFVWCAYALLAYELAVVDFFSALPLASFHISRFPFWAVVLLYLLWSVIIIRMRGRTHRPLFTDQNAVQVLQDQ